MLFFEYSAIVFTRQFLVFVDILRRRGSVWRCMCSDWINDYCTGRGNMKKAICIILFLCTAMVFSGVQTGLAYRNYDGGCGACHGEGASTSLHPIHSGQDCTNCHVDGAGLLPIPNYTCAECHPWPGPGLCPLVDIHTPFASSCTDCHARDCESTVECDLFIKYKKIRFEKLSKDRRRSLSITGDEDFDPFGERDLGPLILKHVFFRERKLRAVVQVPAGLEPQIIPIRVGDCSGEVEIQ